MSLRVRRQVAKVRQIHPHTTDHKTWRTCEEEMLDVDAGLSSRTGASAPTEGHRRHRRLPRRCQRRLPPGRQQLHCPAAAPPSAAAAASPAAEAPAAVGPAPSHPASGAPGSALVRRDGLSAACWCRTSSAAVTAPMPACERTDRASSGSLYSQPWTDADSDLLASRTATRLLSVSVAGGWDSAGG